MGKSSEVSSMDSSPSLSSVAPSEQQSPSAASFLLSLCAYTYLSQLSFILYPSNLSHWYWIIIPPVILSPIPVLHSSSSCLLSVSVLLPIASAAAMLCAVHCRDYSRLRCLLCVQAISPRKWEYLYSLFDKHWPPFVCLLSIFLWSHSHCLPVIAIILKTLVRDLFICFGMIWGNFFPPGYI